MSVATPGRWKKLVSAAKATVLSPQYFPYSVFGSVFTNAGFLPEPLRYRLLFVERANYAYGIQQAARLAVALGAPGLSVLEFGVASGNGLVALERHADFFSRTLGLEIDVVGFDTGEGLPAPVDYRDIPYEWSAGAYHMDEAALRQRLRKASLVLGDVEHTLTGYLENTLRFPIGFIAFDLDYYSSTMSAFKVLEGDTARVMPRVHAYFDDVVTIEWVGAPAAIRDFNAAYEDRKIGRVAVLRDFLPGFPAWADRVYEVHFFEHPRYSELLTPTASHHLPLP